MVDERYDSQFPERYAWASLDSRIASELGEQLSLQVARQLKWPPEERTDVPGLRWALRELWRIVSKG
jgi:hypothetical protein